MDNPIIIALDGSERDAALALAAKLAGKVWGFKVNDLYFACGPEIIHALAEHGNVFCDAKFHDIPNTVANAAGRIARTPAKIITVHASGGEAMLRAASEAAPGRIAAVTVLTSLDEAACRSLYGRRPAEQVRTLAELATAAGCSYLVASAHELANLEDLAPVKIVPGIRPAWYSPPSRTDDQRRVMTPAQAIASGAGLIVMGRPVLRAADPVEAVERTLAEIRAG
jgi:orotidine-5'-phosphate decarboxylase